MKKLLLIAGAILVSSTCWAHLPEGLIRPAVQFPPGQAPIIDSNLSDWDVVTDAYLITHEDLTETVTGLGTERDAADLALRGYVGWSPETNRVYIMEDRFDDAVWVGDETWEGAIGSGCKGNARDFLEIQIDGDHSGGQFNAWGCCGEEKEYSQEEYDLLHGQQAQGYGLRPNGRYAWHKVIWHTLPPYGNQAFTCTSDPGEPGNVYAEYSYTPWNKLIWTGPEDSEIYTLVEGEIFGFNFTVLDSDDGGGYDGYWTLSGDTNSCHHADFLSDFFLSPIDPDIDWASQNRATAVEEKSWGHIKATFAD